MLELGKYSVGVGDRFAHQGQAQLRAFQLAAQQGVDIVPVWNKSHREHVNVGSAPADTRRAADAAVAALGWDRPYHVDADHITLETVDGFLESSDFFTIDVADWIGKPAPAADIAGFAHRHPELVGTIAIPGIAEPFRTTRHELERTAAKFLAAVQQAGRIHRRIQAGKGPGTFIIEVSMDETDSPQAPAELLLILAAVADEGIPIHTVAPKFTGRFCKGVDYAGDLARLEQEFTDDLAVVAYAVDRYGLPAGLKLSVHSGSDKFSIYGPIRRALEQFDAGLHLKTAGTTWLEELIGLAEAGGDGLELAKSIYARAFDRLDELCAPYATVVDIDATALPAPGKVEKWSGAEFASALRHEPSSPGFNPHFRQLLHVAYKVAAALGGHYTDMLENHASTIAAGVTQNLFERHMKPLFLGGC